MPDLIPFPVQEPHGAALTVVANDTPAAAPIESLQEQADDVILQSLFTRQCRVSKIAHLMAQLLYRARSIWIGSGTMPWKRLTPMQQHGYVREIQQLITKAKGEQ